MNTTFSYEEPKLLLEMLDPEPTNSYGLSEPDQRCLRRILRKLERIVDNDYLD